MSAIRAKPRFPSREMKGKRLQILFALLASPTFRCLGNPNPKLGEAGSPVSLGARNGDLAARDVEH